MSISAIASHHSDFRGKHPKWNCVDHLTAQSNFRFGTCCNVDPHGNSLLWNSCWIEFQSIQHHEISIFHELYGYKFHLWSDCKYTSSGSSLFSRTHKKRRWNWQASPSPVLLRRRRTCPSISVCHPRSIWIDIPSNFTDLPALLGGFIAVPFQWH